MKRKRAKIGNTVAIVEGDTQDMTASLRKKWCKSRLSIPLKRSFQTCLDQGNTLERTQEKTNICKK